MPEGYVRRGRVSITVHTTLDLTRSLRLMTTPLYKTFLIDRAGFRECLTCDAIVGNEVHHTSYHERQIRPKRCPKCGLLDIGRHVCLTGTAPAEPSDS
jgi:hypothetical protein